MMMKSHIHINTQPEQRPTAVAMQLYGGLCARLLEGVSDFHARGGVATGLVWKNGE